MHFSLISFFSFLDLMKSVELGLLDYLVVQKSEDWLLESLLDCMPILIAHSPFWKDVACEFLSESELFLAVGVRHIVSERIDLLLQSVLVVGDDVEAHDFQVYSPDLVVDGPFCLQVVSELMLRLNGVEEQFVTHQEVSVLVHQVLVEEEVVSVVEQLRIQRFVERLYTLECSCIFLISVFVGIDLLLYELL